MLGGGMTILNPFEGGTAPNGTYIKLTSTGEWVVMRYDVLLASGKISGFDASGWHRLRLEFGAVQAKAFVNGTFLATLSNASL